MKYKLIFSDFDGTLLRSDGTIGKKSADAIRDYVRRGGNFVVCTGRMNSGINEKWCRYLGIDGERIPFVGFQGAYIESRDGETLYTDFLSPDSVIKIIGKAEELGLHVHTYDPHRVYIGRADYIIREYERVTGAPFTEVGDLADFVRSNRELGYPKVMVVVSPDADIEGIKAEFASLALENVDSYMSSPIFLEFVSRTAGKGNAVRKVASLLGADMSEVIAVGDNQNDLSMIKAAGLGVAVGNALPCLIEAADFVARDHDDDPIAEIIGKFCKGE